MFPKIVVVLKCGHTKVVIPKRIGDTISVGQKMYCMDCAESSKVVDIR